MRPTVADLAARLAEADDMQVVDELLADAEMQPPTIVQEITERKHRRHKWSVIFQAWDDENGDHYRKIWGPCEGCGKPYVEAAVKRGKSSRRLGNDGERRSEKRYGFVKVGEFGGITDLQGKTTKVQQKTSRMAAPVKWKGIFAQLEQVADGRMPAILLSFVRPGVPSDDYFIVRGRDWLDWRGRDE
jgi:hypothetical protein